MNEFENPFRGKFVDLITRFDAANSVYLEVTGVRTIGGSRFLVGIDIDPASYRNGLETWVAVDDLSVVGVCDSRDELLQRVGRGHLPRDKTTFDAV